MFIHFFFPSVFSVVFDVYRDSQVSTLMNFDMVSLQKCHFRAEFHLCVLCVCVTGEGVADRPEPFRRGDGLAAVQLGGADVWWRNRSAAGQPS